MRLTRRRFGWGAVFAAALAVFGRPAAATDGRREHHVRIRRFVFAPPDLTVAAGDIVIWTNDDLAPHSATAVSRGWDTGRLDAGASASVTFDQPGEHHYSCVFHPNMIGRIRVVARS